MELHGRPIYQKKQLHGRPVGRSGLSDIAMLEEYESRAPQNSIEMSKIRSRLDSSYHDHSSQGITEFMEPVLYKTVTTGDVDFFRELSEDLERFPVKQASPRGDTVLHIAAHLGHDQLVKEILKRFLKLVESKNSIGNLPLHVAASAGKLSTVKILVSAGRQFQATNLSAGSSSDVADAGGGLLRVKNSKEDTALHLALKKRSEEVARFLFEADPEVTNYLNGDSDSPLYMAAEAGYSELFELMMEKSVGSDLPDEVLKRRLVDVAINRKNKGVLDVVLSKWPALVPSDNSDRWNHPVSCAAFTGYVEGVEYIINKFKEYCSYVADSDGLYPIHKASMKGHIEIIEVLLKHCPGSRELLNRDNENILHLAAKSGRSKVVRYVLNNPQLEMLINERDREGNTPLHSACKTGRAKVVSILTWDSRVNLEILNNQGMTALDVAELYTGDVPSFRQRLTWQALKHAGAPRSIKRRNVDGNSNSKSLKPLESQKRMDFYKDRVNTLLLVSILVATIAFAAGFTSPTNMTSLLHKSMFHAFVISNTIAMFSSITVVVALIWSQLGDLRLVLASLKFSIPLLGLSLTMVSVAFMTGVYLVVSKNTALAVFVLVCGSIGILSLLLIFAPLYSPTSLNHRIPRYIFYYPLCLLIMVTKSDIED